MRVPLGWLREFVPLPASETLVERLTAGGLEVDAVERTGPDLAGLRVGHVLERAPHPNADRLSLCRVDLGEGEPLEVVCGAPNVAAGQKVALAPPGSRLPDGTKLKRAKIRGVVSNGMICSARELGLGDDAGGILVLDADAPVGAPLGDVVTTGDTVLEIALTPNRGDCASLLGVAREVRAHFGGDVTPPPSEPPEQGAPAAREVSVSIEDPDGCHHYVARVVRGVRVGESPDWLRTRLESMGLRPVNNVVDVTNLVLFELGQPLHAFDLAALRGPKLAVRRARRGEPLATLDGAHRVLEPEDLVIADAERAVAVAGVMGGAETEVGAQTHDVLIESAHFDPMRVRRTARRLGLTTEASYRFERGVDREGVRRAADRCARLLAELAQGSVAPGAVEVRGGAPAVTTQVELDPERVNRLLGTALEPGEADALLARVGVTSAAVAGNVRRCGIPSWRNDLQRAEDLIEEVARIHGYHRIPTTMPWGRLEPVAASAEHRLGEQARDALRALGLVECMTFPFAAEADLDRLGLAADDARRHTVAVRNPLVEEEGRLRPTLVAALLHLVRRNRSRQVDRVRIFELAHVFRARPEGGLPDEPLHVAAAITSGAEARLWEARQAVPLLFQAKGVAERLLQDLGYEAELVPASPEPFLHPHAALEARVAGRAVGIAGELHPETADRFEIDVPTALVVVDLTALARRPRREPRYAEVSRQPRTHRDLAVLLPRAQAAGEVLAAVRQAAGPQCVSAEIFDRYEGQGVPEGRVSLAFRLVFERPDRALTDAEVTRFTDRVVHLLAERFDGELRERRFDREES